MKRLSAKISLGAALLLATTQMAASHSGHEVEGMFANIAHLFGGHGLAPLTMALAVGAGLIALYSLVFGIHALVEKIKRKRKPVA